MAVFAGALLAGLLFTSSLITGNCVEREVTGQSTSLPARVACRLQRSLQELFSLTAPMSATATAERKRSFSEMDAEAQYIERFNRVFKRWKQHGPMANCFRVPDRAEDRRLDKSRLRVASFNAEWLFLFGGTGGTRCPGPHCPWPTLDKAREHFMRVVTLLDRLNADIVHLNEVEDCRVLRMLMEMLPPGHGYRAYMIAGTDSMTRQNVGMLTRVDPVRHLQRSEDRVAYPIPGSTCVRSSASEHVRRRRSGTMGLSKHYLATFEIPLASPTPRPGQSRQVTRTLKLLMAGAHFIAHPESRDRCFRREAQARVLARFIETQLQEHAQTDSRDVEVLITGDLNDYDAEVVGANGHLPLSSALQVLRATGNLPLQSAASFVVDAERRFTSWHDVDGDCEDGGAREHSLIDHVLLSVGLRDRVETVWMDHNSTVSCRDRTSDHWPIVVDLRT